MSRLAYFVSNRGCCEEHGHRDGLSGVLRRSSIMRFAPESTLIMCMFFGDAAELVRGLIAAEGPLWPRLVANTVCGCLGGPPALFVHLNLEIARLMASTPPPSAVSRLRRCVVLVDEGHATAGVGSIDP